MHPQRKIALMTLSLVAAVNPVRSFFMERPITAATRRTFTASSPVPLAMAAPGVEMSPKEEILAALSNPETTVVDARSIGELDQNGFYTPPTARWVHAEATKTEAPLLTVAAETLIPDKEAPVVIYCGSGIRATTCKKVLEEQGYTNVMNAGGLADLNEIL